MTSTIGGGTIGGAGGGSAGTVELVESPLGTMTITNGAGPTVGADVSYAPPRAFAIQGATTTTANNPPNFVPYLQMGTIGSPIILQPGLWELTVAFFISVTSSNTEYIVRTTENGIVPPFPDTIEILGSANAATPRYGEFPLLPVAVPTPFYWEWSIAVNSGPGSVSFVIGYAKVIQVA